MEHKHKEGPRKLLLEVAEELYNIGILSEEELAEIKTENPKQ